MFTSVQTLLQARVTARTNLPLSGPVFILKYGNATYWPTVSFVLFIWPISMLMFLNKESNYLGLFGFIVKAAYLVAKGINHNNDILHNS